MEKKLYEHFSLSTRKEFETINIDTTKSLLVFLSAAIIISVIFVFLERLYYLRIRKASNKTSRRKSSNYKVKK